MNAESKRTWLSSVVFLDIVGYSKCPVAEQIQIKDHMNGIIAEAIAEVAESDRIVVDSGDGAAMCFLGDPEDALFSAVKARDAFATAADDAPQYKVRIGINLGPVKVVRDINQRANVLGDGINVAQRVMAFAKDNQILVSRSFFEVISCLSQEYAELFHYRGAHRDKHVREHQVYEVSLPSESHTYAPSPIAGGAPEPVLDDFPKTAPSGNPGLGEAASGDTLTGEAYTAEPSTGETTTGHPVTAPEGWDPEGLRELQKALAVFEGPLARVLVRKAVAHHAHRDGLLGELAAAIEDPAHRRRFLSRASHINLKSAPTGRPATGPGPTGLPVTTTGADAADFSDATLADLEHALAVYLGPLARVLVKKAARRSSSLTELHELLAQDLAAEKDRREFLRRVVK